MSTIIIAHIARELKSIEKWIKFSTEKQKAVGYAQETATNSAGGAKQYRSF
jgi:hypothetical protein